MAMNDRIPPRPAMVAGALTSKGLPCPTCGSTREYLDADRDVWRVHATPCANDTEQGPTVGVINAHMIGTESSPGEHVSWAEPDYFLTTELAELVGTTVDAYAEMNPHMILWEV